MVEAAGGGGGIEAGGSFIFAKKHLAIARVFGSTSSSDFIEGSLLRSKRGVFGVVVCLLLL